MFERFTPAARQVVRRAGAEAEQLRDAHIGTEHLLLALLSQPDTASAAVLDRHGLTRERAVEAVVAERGTDELDADALQTVGIDLGDVRAKVEAAFGPGALDTPADSRRRRGKHHPFTRRAKKVLELSLREALALKHGYIGEGHILLGLLREGDGVAVQIIKAAVADLGVLRREVTDTLPSTTGKAS